MNSECFVTLTAVSQEQEILVSKTLARLLKVPLNEARNLIKAVPVPIPVTSKIEAQTCQAELEKLGVNISLDSFESFQHNSISPTDDQRFFESYCQELENLSHTHKTLLNCKTELAHALQAQISVNFDQSEITQLRQELQSCYTELESIPQTIEALKTKRMRGVLLLVITAVITFLISSNLMIAFVAVVMMIFILAAMENR
jgi:hypothetical protein